ENGCPVRLHRALGDAELGADLLVELPGDEPLEDFLLPRSEALEALLQLVEPRALLALGLAPLEGLEHRATQLRQLDGLAQHVHRARLRHADDERHRKSAAEEKDRGPLAHLGEDLIELVPLGAAFGRPDQTLARARCAITKRGEYLDVKTERLQELLKCLPLALVALDELHRSRSRCA